MTLQSDSKTSIYTTCMSLRFSDGKMTTIQLEMLILSGPFSTHEGVLIRTFKTLQNINRQITKGNAARKIK